MKKSLLILIASAGFAANSFAATACANPVAELDTNFGKIDIQLNPAKAPISVANFEQYVKSGFYSNKIFHRVIPGFMIQGGGFDKDMKEATTKAPIANEATNGLHNDKYTIAMARTNDPNSATAQFFINVNYNDFLNASSSNPGYAVFGKVIKGQDVVDKIAGVATGTVGMNQDVPNSPVLIKSAKMLACAK
ncbi:MAG: peptidyl-prolyl cis-trans isomerase [Burkholderiales bacterium]|jgi:cyclophilin family peptidyl-prolyl cis-trans isomerase|nr:peptidyl-prolyl cis-trans isomerase [Burkholderiales bacterium]MBP9768166.1 peptidyl-prolyl cis-trans isomerase [Burkholderiales bacterium]MBX9865708.1 peptidyl-prolyl cis-trans isomerase [Burkholderiales bacterium]MDQ5948649.1 peptidyl-prolyl cis-trans isomerase [Pseudomonadota bacterium]